MNESSPQDAPIYVTLRLDMMELGILLGCAERCAEIEMRAAALMGDPDGVEKAASRRKMIAAIEDRAENMLREAGMTKEEVLRRYPNSGD